MNKIKLIIVDDHQMFRDGLKFMLSENENIDIIGEAEDGEKFIRLLDTLDPDIVLMDINMPHMNGVDATKKALEIKPNIKIIVISMFGDENYYYQMIQAGAKGFVMKQSGSDELKTAIETVAAGNDYFSNELLKNVIISIGSAKQIKTNNEIKIINFTQREKDVLKLLCNGFSAKEIASKLNISPRTVEVHKSNLFTKTGVKNTGNLIALAIKSNLIEL